MEKKLRLPQTAPSAGCAAKIGPALLEKILRGLPVSSDERLLVGFDTSDDACVYQIDENTAMVQTVDFFPPMVDDPYLFGQIAAANALSDIYAMGALPVLALNLLCFPAGMDPEVVRAVLLGGGDKVREAGAVTAGGHTVDDSVLKYGLCVSGLVSPGAVLTNSGAREGDALVLTKPLGAGILTTALKGGCLPQEARPQLWRQMCFLNRAARDAALACGAHACTDVTGFGLLGHSCEMARGSGVTLALFGERLPALPRALELAKMGFVPSGAYRNLEFVRQRVRFDPSLPRCRQDLLCDPQTSGGLLIALEEGRARELLDRLGESGHEAAVVGSVQKRGDWDVTVSFS